MSGGVHALVKLARLCKVEGVQEQVSLVLSLLPVLITIIIH